MGADTVLETGNETSSIALDLGVNASDLVSRSNGHDLWLDYDAEVFDKSRSVGGERAVNDSKYGNQCEGSAA